MQRARDGEKRRRGLAIALGAILVAALLEGLLLLKASLSARASLRDALDGERESGEGSVNWSSSAFKGGEGSGRSFIVFGVRWRFELPVWMKAS